MHHTYAIHSVPRDGDTRIIRKFAALHSEALRAIYPGEDLILQAPKILTSPNVLHEGMKDVQNWICVAPNAFTGATSLAEGQWVGMYALRGPLKPGECSFFDADMLLEEGDSLWVARRMYVQEGHRCKEALVGLQQALEAHIREHHKSLGSSTGKAHLRMTAKEGSAAFALHSINAEKLRELEYREVLQDDGTTRGLPHALVEGTLEEVWRRRCALFEMRVDLQLSDARVSDSRQNGAEIA
jgi:hypothetical protein